jgi:hypothetical protein
MPKPRHVHKRRDDSERVRLLETYAQDKAKNDEVKRRIKEELKYYTKAEEDEDDRPRKKKPEGCKCSDYFLCFFIPRPSCVTRSFCCATRTVLLGWFYLMFIALVLVLVFGGFNVVSWFLSGAKFLTDMAFGRLFVK